MIKMIIFKGILAILTPMLANSPDCEKQFSNDIYVERYCNTTYICDYSCEYTCNKYWIENGSLKAEIWMEMEYIEGYGWTPKDINK